MLDFIWEEVYGPERRFKATKIRFDRPWSFPAHRHVDYVELSYVVEGTLEQCCCGNDVTARAGQLCIFREGSSHSLSGEDFLFYNLNFRLSEYERLVEFLGLGSEISGVFPQAGGYRILDIPEALRPSLLRQTETLLRMGASLRRRLAFQRALLQWVDELLLFPELAPRRGDVPGDVQQLIRRVEQDFSPDLSVADMADMSGWAPYKLSRMFRKYMHTTPSTFLNQLRVQRAAALLRNTNLDITSVAMEAGFENLSYFFRLFRAELGQTPREYRAAFPRVDLHEPHMVERA